MSQDIDRSSGLGAMRTGDAPIDRPIEGGASFSFAHRLHRAVWRMTWLSLAAWTPAALSPWRVALLRLFGAEMHPGSAIAASANVWLPRNLELGPRSSIGPGVNVYNMAPIKIGARTIVSQKAVLCGGTHDISDPAFPLRVRPITVGDDVWIASEAFVGPGVRIGHGCVLAARGCAFEDLEPWTVYRGNPAAPLKQRTWRKPADPRDAALREAALREAAPREAAPREAAPREAALGQRPGAGERLRITCVLGPFFPVPPVRGGAVERIWQNLCEEMATQGHAVTLISRQFEGFPNQEDLNGVHHVRLPSTDAPTSKLMYRLLDVLFSLRVCRALNRSDITVTNSVSLPLMIPRRKAGKIYMSIARFPKGQFGFYRRADRMQSVSTHVGRAICEQSPSVAPLVKSIPNAISQTFAQALEDDRGPRLREILFVGRVAREKGLDLLIRAFARVQARFPDWTLTVIGPHSSAQGGDGDSCLDELKSLAASLKTPVVFAGPIYDEHDLVRRLTQSDVFVYPSVAVRGEALPLAPVEAMACGCAVLVSSLDCFNDYLSDGVNGAVFDERDASGEALASKLDLLLSDPDMRRRLGTAAVTTARTYTRKVVAARFLADFHELRSNRT